MKKTAKALVFLLVMVTALAVSSGTALASEYDHCAGALQSLGLFKGAATGFELDRQATRAEAAVMLVRLLGAEEKAQNGAYSHPFTDVPEWASPHIAYMYETGLTKGTGETTFTPQGICDIQMYSTFILRALGYEEGEDNFTYKDAANFAWELGLVDMLTGYGTFLRDNMAAISYTALFAKPKGANATLLSQLVTQGAVNSAAAEPYFALFTEYTRLNRASYLAADRREIQVNMSLNMDAGAEGGIKMDHKGLLQMDFSGSGDTEYIEDILNGLKMSMTNQVAYFGGPAGLEHEMDFKLDISLRDGVCYINTDAGEAMGLPLPEKIQTGINLPGELIFSVPTTFFVEMVVFQTAEAANNRPPAAYYGIAQIKDIKIFDTENGGKRLDITYPLVSSNIVLQGMESFVFSSAMQLIYMITMGLDFTAGDITQSCFLDKNGVCTGLKLDMSLNETVFTGAGEELTVELSAQLEYHITDTGRGVKITPPPGKAEDYTELLDVLDDLYMAGLF